MDADLEATAALEADETTDAEDALGDAAMKGKANIDPICNP
jgi:hypothetical protein